MKYLLIVAAVAILVRIDWVLRVFDRSSGSFKTKETQVEESEDDQRLPQENLGFKNDPSLKKNPRQLFLGFLRDFSVAPNAQSKQQMFEILTTNPELFPDDDSDLAAGLSDLRSQMAQKNRETSAFLVELTARIKVKNIEAVKAVFVTLLDTDVVEFLAVYRGMPDSTCTVALIPSTTELELSERIFEYSERLKAFEQYLASDKVEIVTKPLATNCQLQLRLQLDKLQVPPALVEQSAVTPETVPAPTTTPPSTNTTPASAAPATTPAPAPTATPTPAPGTAP